jgi:hypothetical protein
MFPNSVGQTQASHAEHVRERGADHLSGIKEQLRKNYEKTLEFTLPEELADLISQLDRAP